MRRRWPLLLLVGVVGAAVYGGIALATPPSMLTNTPLARVSDGLIERDVPIHGDVALCVMCRACGEQVPPSASPYSYYWSAIRVIILNIGRYIAMMMTPTIIPTPIIINGSMIDVSDWIELSTSSS